MRLAEVVAPSSPPVYGWTPRAGGLVHRLLKVQEVPPSRVHDGYSITVWRCGNACNRKVKLASAAPAGARLCSTCSEAGVYLARVGEYLKVGHSVCVAKRMLGLDGELVDTIPGSRLLERSVLDACPPPARGREWFSVEDEDAIRRVFDEFRDNELDDGDSGSDVTAAVMAFAHELGITPQRFAEYVESAT